MNIVHAPFRLSISITPVSACELGAKVCPTDEKQRKTSASRREKKLDAGEVETDVKNLRVPSVPSTVLAELFENEAVFFEHNAERMRSQFRAQKPVLTQSILGTKTAHPKMGLSLFVSIKAGERT